ncbi:hypothetical protein [Dietzia sp. ANT_WB102]|uniref:hypothetical protein n=1 Tax=Dietzia sp. ANT_WB102 TaxID=2597345 RepID=UPI0011EF7E19|nr:hypothetical protein [Dietzia sp. ANT_WB102]KAA0918206.1 hypothetical protein FQ137_02200 [Dietzia sp. ANT_WB102]
MRNAVMLGESRPDGRATANSDAGSNTSTTTSPGPPTGATHATVFPAPLTTIVAALAGGLLGFAAIYGVASRLAGSLTAVVAIGMLFALTLAGPRVHAAARTELGRTVAVVLEAIGFGGVVSAVIILA